MSGEPTDDLIDSGWVQQLGRYRPEYLRLTQAASRLASGEGISHALGSELHEVCEALVGAGDPRVLEGRAALLDALDGANARAVRTAIEDLRTACLAG